MRDSPRDSGTQIWERSPHVPQPREPWSHVAFGFPLTGEKEVKDWPLPLLPVPTFALFLVRHQPNSLEDRGEVNVGMGPSPPIKSLSD